MNRPLFVIAAAVLAAGCNKPGPTPPGGNPVANVGLPAEEIKPPPKKPEAPRLTPRYRFKTGIKEDARVAITDDGSRVAVSCHGPGRREQIEVWDLTMEPKKVREIPGTLRAFSPDGELLTRPGKNFDDSEVVATATGAVVCVVPAIGHFQRFAGPNTLVIVRASESFPGGKIGTLLVGVYNARTGKQESGFEIPSPSLADIRGPVSGGREIVVGWRSTSRVEVWDLGTGKMTRGVTLPNARPEGHWDSFETSQDGKRVTAKRLAGQPVGVYDTATGSEVATTGSQDNSAFVPGRDLILGRNSWIGEGFQTYSGWRAYDLTKNMIVADLPGGYLYPAISADGRVMVTRTDRDTPELLVWDLTRIP